MEIDLSRLDARTRAAIDGHYQDKFHRDLAAAVTRQTSTAKVTRDRPQEWGVFGPQGIVVDPFIDALWTACYGHNWRENKDLMRFLAKRNPEIAGQSHSPEVQVGYGRKVAAGALRPPAVRSANRPTNRPTQRRGCRFMPGTLALAK